MLRSRKLRTRRKNSPKAGAVSAGASAGGVVALPKLKRRKAKAAIRGRDRVSVVTKWRSKLKNLKNRRKNKKRRKRRRIMVSRHI
jgi:hypothetical protein